MTALAGTMAGAYGVYLLYTAAVLGWRGVGVGPRPLARVSGRQRARRWLAQAGLDDVEPAQFAGTMALVLVATTVAVVALFGALAPALAAGAFAASYPLVAYRARRRRRRRVTAEAWPRMIEEIALLTGALGRSVPQALLEVGRGAPAAMRPAFEAARREWLLTTDFERTTSVLKARLADPTADAACETLLVAHELGGADLDRRLAALVEDRLADVQGRRDAEARQAGVRFARRFVLLVPLGMALTGLSIGDGRTAYGTAEGQALAVTGVVLVAACWWWSGRIMRLPEEQRVFLGDELAGAPT